MHGTVPYMFDYVADPDVRLLPTVEGTEGSKFNLLCL